MYVCVSVWLSSSHWIQLTPHHVQTANTTVTPTQDRLAKSTPPPPKKKQHYGLRGAFGAHEGEEKCIWAFGW